MPQPETRTGVERKMTGKRAYVRVTQAHIDAGMRLSAVACPIALALTDAIAPAPEERPFVFVWAGTRVLRGYLRRDGSPWRGLAGPTSPAARRFMERFDKGEAVKPTGFWLSIVATEEEV